MKKRNLCLGLVVIVTQLFGTGCFFHPVARWRANHPCGTYHHHPLLHPIQTRRAIFGTQNSPPGGADVTVGSGGPVVTGSPVGPVMMNPPCHGCESHGVSVVPGGIPVTYGGGPIPYGPPGEVMPGGIPTIGQPMPIAPGPKVVPSYELPHPMPVPKNGNGGN